MATYRLAAVISHPVQYQSPLFRKLAAHHEIDLTVYYGTNYGVTEQVDPGFGVRMKWNTQLLEGYRSVFLKNYSPVPHTPENFFWTLNFGIIPALWENRYDAVMIHGYNLATCILAYLGAWLSGTPVLFRGETVLKPSRPWWIIALKSVLLKPLFWGTAAFLTIGSRSKKFYTHYGVPDEKLFFTPYSVDNDFWERESDAARREMGAIRARLGLRDDAAVILFAGKLIPKKRPFDLLKAYENILHDKVPLHRNVNLLFVGDGVLRGELECYARERNLPGVRFAGFVNQREMPTYFGVADLFILPSGPGEVSPLAINEAMASGLPIVVSNAIPSAADFVADAENGCIVPEGDVGELSRVMVQLVNGGDSLKVMGRNSRKKIASWNYDVCVEEFYNALRFVSRSHGKK